MGHDVTLHVLDVGLVALSIVPLVMPQAIIRMLRVTIAVAMILAIILLVVKTSVVQLPALPGLSKSHTRAIGSNAKGIYDNVIAMLAG